MQRHKEDREICILLCHTMHAGVMRRSDLHMQQDTEDQVLGSWCLHLHMHKQSLIKLD